MAQHEMVLRTIRIRVPCLRQRCGALRQLIAVARSVCAFQHVVENIRPAAFQQCIHDVVIAHISGCHVVAMRSNVGNQRCEHARPLLRRNQSDHQGHRLRGLAAFVVSVLICIEETSIE